MNLFGWATNLQCLPCCLCLKLSLTFGLMDIFYIRLPSWFHSTKTKAKIKIKKLSLNSLRGIEKRKEKKLIYKKKNQSTLCQSKSRIEDQITIVVGYVKRQLSNNHHKNLLPSWPKFAPLPFSSYLITLLLL